MARDNLAFRAKQKKKAAAAVAAGGSYSQPVGSIGARQTALRRGDPTGGGMSPAFRAKFEQAKAEERGEGIQPTQGISTTPTGKVDEFLFITTQVDDAFKAQFGDPHQWSPEVFQHYEDTVKQQKITGYIKAGAIGAATILGGWLGIKALTPYLSAPAFETAKVKGQLININPNVKHLGLTGKILATLGISGGAVTLALATLGSYPFAGFIGKEETIQTLGFGYRAAMDAGNYDMADAALDEMDEVLYGASTLGDKIPVANIANALKDFASGAKVTLEAQRELVQRMRDGTDKWSLINKAKEESEKRITDYFNEQALIRQEAQRNLNAIADARQREKASLFWLDHQKKMAELAEIERKKVADFWLEYWKQKLRLQEDAGRSQLGFGLFR